MSNLYADIQLEVWGNTLVLKVVGPTGVEEMDWVRQQLIEKYLAHLSPPWAILGDATQWDLYTPELKAAQEEYARWHEEQGMRFAVIVTPENSIKRAAAQDLRVDGLVTHHYVSSMDEAVHWLSERQLWGKQKA